MQHTVNQVEAELQQRTAELKDKDCHLQAKRLEERTRYDLEQLQELGRCRAIENYSRYLSGRNPGAPPPCLLDYLEDNALVIVDESHVTVPQIASMYKGDQARVDKLIQHGYRLPSAQDHRPLTLTEFEARVTATVFMSATPATYELDQSQQIVEQLVRPTGIPDPLVELRPASNQVDDLMEEIHYTTSFNERVLIMALTRKTAEDLTEYLVEHDITARYLHADLDVAERDQQVQDLRTGECNVLVGINLLREGLDVPEVSLVAVLDADKEGFLRSKHALTQVIGRAARNANGRAILYADERTDSIERAVEENVRRRRRQYQHNDEHGITPRTATAPEGSHMLDPTAKFETDPSHGSPSMASCYEFMDRETLELALQHAEQAMFHHAENLEFEKAAELRDSIISMQRAFANA